MFLMSMGVETVQNNFQAICSESQHCLKSAANEEHFKPLAIYPGPLNFAQEHGHEDVVRHSKKPTL